MSSPFNSSSQRFSQHNAALGHQRNVDANHRALQNHRSSGGGGGGGLGGLLALAFLILVVLLITGVLG
jgi:hypothetical protein